MPVEIVSFNAVSSVGEVVFDVNNMPELSDAELVEVECYSLNSRASIVSLIVSLAF